MTGIVLLIWVASLVVNTGAYIANDGGVLNLALAILSAVMVVVYSYRLSEEQ